MSTNKINVTKTFLPPREIYDRYLNGIWESGWITNNGPLTKELTDQLKGFLGVDELVLCNNGTIAIQIALKALNITGEVITTPFSYVATTNSILWENCTPVFADIREDDFCIDASRIEEKITERTQAILAVHVYGLPCDVEKIEAIAKKHNLRVIYDAAHAFGVQYKDKSILSYGDISTCSFHATKLFHTVEGGAVIAKDPELSKRLQLLHMFGHIGDEYFCLGINGKNSEFHAAMGLSVLPFVKDIIAKRKTIFSIYDEMLNLEKISKPKSVLSFDYNYAYYPVLFENEATLLRVREMLEKNGIFTRRYFYPSLNQLHFIKYQSCPVSENISKRILALPLFYELEKTAIERISQIINSSL
jgi:dTDP-4-amino-4,6-dideoxygalactose transaminase